MPLNTLPSVQTPDEQKSLCALLAHLLSASSYGFQHSVQQITQRLFRHIKAGYSFSKTELNSLTTQLVEQNLLWKLPFGPHYKVTTDAVPFIIINLQQHQTSLIAPLLAEISHVYHQQDKALNFITLLLEHFNNPKKRFIINAEFDLGEQFVHLLGQSQFANALWQILPKQWQQECLIHFTHAQFFNLMAPNPWPTLVNSCDGMSEHTRYYFNENLAILLQDKQYDELLDSQADWQHALFLEANTLAIKGDAPETALTHYKSALTRFRKRFGKGYYPAEMTGLLYTLSLLINGSAADMKQLTTCKKWYYKHFGEDAYTSIAVDYLLDNDPISHFPSYRLVNRLNNLMANPNAVAALFCFLIALVKYANDEQIDELRGQSALLKQLLNTLADHSHWVGEQCLHLAKWLFDDSALPNEGILQHFSRVPQWQRWLDEVSQINEQKDTMRVIWQLDLTHLDLPLVQARVKQLNAKNEWTKGRKVAIHDLKNEQYQAALTEADINLIDVIYNHAGFGYQEVQATATVLQTLIGFNNLEDHRSAPLTLIKGEFIIEIAKDLNDCYKLVLQPTIDDYDGDFLLTHSHGNSYQVFAVDEKQQKLQQLFEQQPNNLTEERLPQLNAALKALSSDHHISSQRSEFAEVNNVRLGDCQFSAVIKLTHMGIDVNFYVMPHTVDGPWLEPGEGATSIVYNDDTDSNSVVVKRDLKAEKRTFKKLLKNLNGVFVDKNHQLNSSLQQFFIPEDISQAIETLEQANKSKALVLSWDESSQGMKLASSKHLSLNLNDDSDWLSVSGDVSLPSGDIYTLQTLLKAPRRGSIINLDDEQSLILDQRLTNLLNRLEGMQHDNADTSQLRIANARALPLHQTLADLGDVTFGENWKTRLAKFDQTVEPILPAHLVNVLRDYQIIGVKWLMQLANWGLNACLADDMGLGKTLQTLSVLQMRSHLGASLVVAPKSVCHNWQAEAERFACTLNIKTIANATLCEDVLSNSRANDLIIVSYGLLPLIGEQLAKLEFTNIVFDEAQAIKNPLSLRAKAAFALNGQFKIALSGTPIENHLGELWSLFNFLMPGFLHTLPMFKKRFGNADKNQQQADTLKTLIAPFILRRTKQTVLTELPEKTEINLTFALSEKEQALYEATRLNALEQANQDDSQYITILASLTKLRRACIAPQLLLENSKMPSSKLDTAEAIITELLENNHQALIFSQFVDVLKLVEQRLQKRGVDYCYLDGSMSTNKRKQQVELFQAGKAPLFLISLKAGGTGLNLTAADYVLHLDPWWNPAVEQQASDRAHRLGQTRPVTVYRLIAKDTIEEKILQLHEHKQALADKLLAGSGDVGQLSKDQLLALLAHQAQ
ncbi:MULTISPECIES: DEAD/DEAH box helicase [unclassified Pseudoalteromonas]|uniref:DEAD/DEAH box helicase n=1 Tax=unclassified Pseudoalteromonas TaxID=194690 RepID=UPI000C08C9C3|nr:MULTISPECIES: DEAD/DEAH box helicase [unclassified Pseudoalteromonas]MDP2633355.1 DEAD/DEAH box helicase [Pseudoalteromonas sp. 1_MG-2023]PHN91677.1 helicase [Pseudoalteromonas sp. 3D05]